METNYQIIIILIIFIVGSVSILYANQFYYHSIEIIEFEEISKKSERFDPIVLQCLTGHFNCDINNEYFEGCISGKIDGITIEELCASSDIKIENGCISVEFDDDIRMVTCH